jgi:hypothetical protein
MKPTISKKEGFKSDAQRKAAFANGYEEKDKKNEGKKRFKRQDGIGKAKYTISYHDGKKKHKDGSDFFDIKIFKNKKDLSDFVGTLAKQGYKLTRESVNENAYKNWLKRNNIKDNRDNQSLYHYLLKKHKSVSNFPKHYESVNEAYIVLYSPKKGVKPVTTAAYKDKKDAQKWAKDLGGITMIVKKKVKGIDESRFAKKPEVTPKQLLKIQNDIKKVNRKIKVYISKHPVTKGELSIELGHGHDNDAEIDKIYSILKKHTGSYRTGSLFNESVINEAKVETERFFGKKGIIIMIRDGNKMVSAIFKDKKNADKFNRNNPSDVKKLLQLAKKTKFPKAIDESVNEILVIVDKFDKRKQDYDKVYYQDGGKRPGDGDINKAQKEFAKLSKKHKGLTLISVDRNSKMYDVNESVNERINPKFYDARVQYIDPKSKKKFVGDVVRYDNGEYKVNLGKDGRFEKYILAKEKDLKIVSKSKKKTFESVNEGKYNYKADALTAYFKGKIDAKELDRIARDDFKSGIATKKELSNFLSNKFTQDVMSDTYGIPAGTLIKRVRGLMKFAEGVDIVDQGFLKAKPVKETEEDSTPQGYNPMVEDKKQIKDLVKKVKHEKLFYDVLATMEKKYGKNKYRIWLEKSLRDFGVNPKHYDYRTNAAAEEKLFQLGK